MRILTSGEVREIEILKEYFINGWHRQIDEVSLVSERPGSKSDYLVIDMDSKEFWLEILNMALQTNEALSLAWKRSPNPKTDIVELVRSGLS